MTDMNQRQPLKNTEPPELGQTQNGFGGLK